MTIADALHHTRGLLADSNILVSDVELETELILQHSLGFNRAVLYLSLGDELDEGQRKNLQQITGRRLTGEPLAYIIGHQQFCGLDFLVNSDVLIPRPETEQLVRKAISLASGRPAPLDIADIGTGSGAIAISMAKNVRDARIFAVDISPRALEVAYFNCRWHRLTGRIQLLRGDLLTPLPHPMDIIIANLPYVRESILRDFPNKHEPGLALTAGPDGLREIRRLCHQAKTMLRSGGSLILEIGTGQKEALFSLLAGLFPAAEIEALSDFNGLDRMVSLTLPA
jgi:release factor glutamine methyltransferase